MIRLPKYNLKGFDMKAFNLSLNTLYLFVVCVVGFEAYQFTNATNDCTDAIVKNVGAMSRSAEIATKATCSRMDAHATMVNGVLDSLSK